VLIKTLKPSEFDILFEEDGFLEDYFEHTQKNPQSLLSRFLGVYEVKVNKSSSMKFLITENMMGQDFTAVKRCYDLKGSTFDRITAIDLYNEITGESGLNVLKDQNLQDYVDKNQKMEVSVSERNNFLQILKEDSQLLKKHNLIDYSVFLLEIDRQKRIMPKNISFASMVFDATKKHYIMQEVEELGIDKGSINQYKKLKT